MTYNIRHGVGMDRVLDLERTARVIEVAIPDIVVLNEMDDGTARSFGVFQADSLGQRLNMHSRFGRSIDYDGGQYGNALLSKFPILDFKIIDLSIDSLLEGRSVFLATLDLQPDTLFVMGTHLGLQTIEQHKQVSQILSYLPQTASLILAGDFNFEPDSEMYQMICRHLEDGLLKTNPSTENTFPANQPDRRIDYIFIGRNIAPTGAPKVKTVEISTASDHLPQVLEFVIK